MISLPLIIWILFVHWVADFVCQSRGVAIDKSKDNWALSYHTGIYSWVLTLGVFIYAALAHWDINKVWGVFVFVLINGAVHWATDYFTSRLNAKLWAKTHYHNFFVSIGFDQWIHAATLLTTAWYILS